MTRKAADQNPFLPKYDIPEVAGYQDQSGELVGYWDPEQCYIHVIPLEVTLFDNKVEPIKPSALITCELVDGCPLVKIVDEVETLVEGHPGDRVGIWYSPGMRGIVTQGGEPTLLAANGTKEIANKPNDMKLYVIRSAKRGVRLPVTQDHRKESLKAGPTIFDRLAPAGPGPSAVPTRVQAPAGEREYF